MKKILLIVVLAATSLLARAAVITVTAPITSNTTWVNTNTYILSGFIYVRNGATLTINPGTLIIGENSTKGALIVQQGGKLIADGTPDKPIVFTSEQPAGSRNYGDWGGVILLGYAPINQAGGVASIEGGIPTAEGYYGGNDPADNSGIIRYVRIEWAGIAFAPNNEVNGLTCGGVGTGTIIDYVQVSMANDDGFEFFGGTVNAKHLIALRCLDDDLDTDNGYRGKIQFAVVLRDSSVADVSGSNGFESDNDATGSSNSPVTQPWFSNITVVGPQVLSTTTLNINYKRALHLRRNTQTSVYNSVFMGYPTGLLIDGTAAETNAGANTLQFQNNFIAGCATPLAVNAGSVFDINGYYASQGGNVTYTNCSDVQLTNAFNYINPNFLPLAGSPALSGASFTNARLTDPFFENVSYRGAFGTTDWTLCWSNFNPQATNYPLNTPISNGPTVSIAINGTSSFCDSVQLTSTHSPVVAYQWYKNGVPIAGANSSTYYATSTGSYKLTVTNANDCQKTSSTKSLTKKSNPTKPVIRASCDNGVQFFKIKTYPEYASYQWKRNNFNVSGGTTPNVQSTVAGTYNVTVTGTNGCIKKSDNRVSPITPIGTTQLATNKCGKYNYDLSSSSLSISPTVAGAKYEYIFVDSLNPGVVYARKVKSAPGTLTLSSVTPGLQLNTTYFVTVRAVLNSDTGCVGNTCSIRISQARFGDGIEAVMTSAGQLDVYPNPAADAAVFSFSLETAANVSFQVYDVNGKLTGSLETNRYESGANTVDFNSGELQNGIYFVRMIVDGQVTENTRINIVK